MTPGKSYWGIGVDRSFPTAAEYARNEAVAWMHTK